MSTRTIAGLSVGSVGDARWFAPHPAKAWGERLYLLYAPVWMTAMAVVQHSDAYRAWRDVGHLVFSIALFLPLWVIPLAFPPAADRGRPLAARYIFKINVWIGIFAFIQSYFGTHYFYKVLGMRYGFPVTWELNGVPFMLYLLAFVYFTTYQALINLPMRRVAIARSSGSTLTPTWSGCWRLIFVTIVLWIGPGAESRFVWDRRRALAASSRPRPFRLEIFIRVAAT